MIEIIVNGKKEEVTEKLSILEIVKLLDYKLEWSAIALNGTLVHIKSYDSTIVKENDHIEILSPIQGG